MDIKTDADFARFLGIKPQTLSSWYSRNTFDIELLYTKCGDINANWLLTGKGNMLKNQDISINNKENNGAIIGNNHGKISIKRKNYHPKSCYINVKYRICKKKLI